jgi:hypothetical protein
MPSKWYKAIALDHHFLLKLEPTLGMPKQLLDHLLVTVREGRINPALSQHCGETLGGR